MVRVVVAAWVATDHSPISQRMPRRACAGVEAASSRADAATHVHEARPGQSAHGAILASTAKSALSRLVCASQPRRHRQLTRRFPLPSLSMFPRSFPDLRPRRSPRRSLFHGGDLGISDGRKVDVNTPRVVSFCPFSQRKSPKGILLAQNGRKGDRKGTSGGAFSLVGTPFRPSKTPRSL